MAFAPAALIIIVSAAPVAAKHGVPGAGGPYDGFATGSVFHVDALTTAGPSATRALDLEVGVANAQVDSVGLSPVHSEYQRLLIPDVPEDAHAGGYSTILEAGEMLSAPDAENQVHPFTATALSPGATPSVDRSVVNQAVGTALFIDLLHNIGQTRWNSDTCVIGAPIASGQELLARLEVLETGDDEATPPSTGFDKPVFALDANRFGPPRATTHVISNEILFKGSGPGLGLYSVTATTLAPVTLFQGTPQEFTIEVDGPTFLVARADGTSGGAKVDYSAPIVSIIQGDSQTKVPSAPIVVRVPETGDAIAQVKINTVDPLPAPKGLDTATTSTDGTRAAAQANVVEIKLLDNVGGLQPGATIALGHMEAAATVPPGGIVCPLPVTKVANPPSVVVGNPFATTITISNPFSCPLKDVHLADAITVQSNARFQIQRSVPAAASFTSGALRASGSASWNIGTIEPGGSKAVVVTLGAQNGAGKILDTATASGTLTNCPVSPAEAGADVTGLADATVGVSGSATLTEPTVQVLGVRIELPRTGVGDRVTPFAGLAFIGLALLLARTTRRRVA